MTAVSSGMARITVKTSNGLSDWCDVTVSAPQIYATITEAKYATFCDNYPRNFSSTGITVYTVKYDNGASVLLSEVADGVVPARTPVLLYKDVNSEESVLVPEGSYNTQPLEDNQLKVSDGLSAYGENVYVLAKKTHGVGFYHWGPDNSLSKDKVYLFLPGEAESREYINIEDGYTTVVNVITNDLRKDNMFYDLLGHRVENPSKGIYIMCPVNGQSDRRNGKKVVLK